MPRGAKHPVWQRLEKGAQVLAVFQGPQAYISPGWYPQKAENGQVVPTWNYLAVHVQGKAKVVQDAGWLGQHIRNLTDQHEAGMASPWSVDDAPATFTGRLVKAIVGIEIEIEGLTGKLKASQNQTDANRRGVEVALDESEESSSRAMADFMR